MNKAQQHSHNAGMLLQAVAMSISGQRQDITLLRARHRATDKVHYLLCAINDAAVQQPDGTTIEGQQVVPLAIMLDEVPQDAYDAPEEIPTSELLENAPQLILPPGAKGLDTPAANG